ncbi:MAG: RsmG family class I SAM-dependent methyltransferase [Acidimicrobiales bacterium]
MPCVGCVVSRGGWARSGGWPGGPDRPGGWGRVAVMVVDRAALFEVLEEGQRRGLLGPGAIDPQIDHALAVGTAIGEPGPGRALDLGTGGGLPGLVLAGVFPQARWVLLDSRRRSVSFVGEAIAGLGLADRVEALLGRAEDVGRDPVHRARYDLVVARGFGPPAVTAECAAPMLQVGGRLIVTEPPGGQPDRWPAEPLARLGLRLQARDLHQQIALAVLEQVEPAPATYPRRSGVPGKRPLFSVSRETQTST